MAKQETTTDCKHPPTRLYCWVVDGRGDFDDVLVICCCECGEVLQGAYEL